MTKPEPVASGTQLDDAQTAQPFEEVWNIVRHGHGDQAWRLAGIQQIGR